MNSRDGAVRGKLFVKSTLAGLSITIATYLAALACAAAQLHSAVVVLAWPSFVVTRLLPPGEPVTCCSPSSPLLLLTTVGVAWLFYSAVCYIWFSRRGQGRLIRSR
jgi:hypothetical protein